MSRQPAGGPTLEQVAALAGVGRGTASRAINGGEHVSERSRAAVQAAVAELGYVPNRAARSLVTKRTDAIALVIAESEERIFGQPFFAGVIRGISVAVTDAGRQLVLLLAQAGRRTEHLDGYLTRQHVDGVLLVSLHDDDALPQQIRERGLPVVLGGRPVSGTGGGFVDMDNEHGARLVVDHLLARGRRAVGTIAGPPDMTAGRDRHAGFVAALSDAGRPADPDLTVHGDFTQDSGERAMRELLARRPDVDGVFCANDLMAAGALQVLRDAGRRVPEDVSVVGFDDSPMALSTHPPLTSVHQSSEDMGRVMVELLFSQMAEPVEPPRSRVLPTHLVVRASS
jgi:DNA-binding LacI/PurR family transcriptional regulator